MSRNRTAIFSVWRSALPWISWLPLAATVAGCGPATGTVSGQITLDGTPLPSGFISFSAEEGPAPPVTTIIQDGAYEVTMVAGKKRVQISAPGPSQQRPAYNSPDAPLMEVPGPETIPEKYNTRSDLIFDVQPGKHTKDWPLATHAP